MLGIYVQERRSQLGLSIADVRDRTKISISRLEQIESGKIDLRAGTMSRLSDCLGLSEDYIHRLERVARIDYINELINFMRAKAAEEPSARFP
jgi:transcriptional regulator with XRE-family HTH domain